MAGGGQGGGYGGGMGGYGGGYGGGMGAPTPEYGQVPGGSGGMGGDMGGFSGTMGGPGFGPGGLGTAGMGGFGGGTGGVGGGLPPGTYGIDDYMEVGSGGAYRNFGDPKPMPGVGPVGQIMPYLGQPAPGGGLIGGRGGATPGGYLNSPIGGGMGGFGGSPFMGGGYGGGMGGYGGMPFFGGYGGGMGGFSRGFGSPFRGGFGGIGGMGGGMDNYERLKSSNVYSGPMNRPAVMPINVAGGTYTTGMQPDISKNDLQTIQSILGTDQANAMNRMANLSDADRQTLRGIEQRFNSSRFPINVAGGTPSMSTPDQAPPQMMNRPAVMPRPINVAGGAPDGGSLAKGPAQIPQQAQAQAQPSRQRVPRLQDLQNRLRSAFGNDIVGKPVNAGWLPLIGTPYQPAELTSLYGIPPYRPPGQSATQESVPGAVPKGPVNPEYPGLQSGVKPSDLKPGTYYTPENAGPKPNPGDNPQYPLPTLPPAGSAQGAYDQELAQYNSPEYAAYYNSLAPSTRAYMHAPGNQQTGQHLADQARINWEAYRGKDPFSPRPPSIPGKRAGGIASLLKRK